MKLGFLIQGSNAGPGREAVRAEKNVLTRTRNVVLPGLNVVLPGLTLFYPTHVKKKKKISSFFSGDVEISMFLMWLVCILMDIM